MPSAKVFGFSKRQLKMLEVIILLNAMALSLVLPSVTSTGEPSACTTLNKICSPILSDFSNAARVDGASSATIQISATQNSEAIILFIFEIENTPTIPHVTTITDSQLDSYTFQIFGNSAIMGEEIWTGVLKTPLTTTITVSLNQSSTTLQIIALDYPNVISFSNPTAQGIDTTTVNFIKTFDNVSQTNPSSTQSGAWIAGASAIECAGCGLIANHNLTVASPFVTRVNVPSGNFAPIAADTNASISSFSALTFQASFSGLVNNIGMTQDTILILPRLSSPVLPLGACDGLLRSTGRCFLGTTNGCTVPAGSSSCSTVITFPQPFTGPGPGNPTIFVFVGTSVSSYQSLTFNGEFTANQTNWPIPAVLTEFLNDSTHRLFLRQGIGYNWVNTKQLGSFFIQVIKAGPTGSNIILQCAPSLVPASTAWINVTNPISISSAGIKLATFSANAGIFPTGCGTSQSTFTSLRVVGYGGNNSTIAQFGRIQLETSETLSIIATCGASAISTTSWTMVINLSNLQIIATPIICVWKAESLTG